MLCCWYYFLYALLYLGRVHVTYNIIVLYTLTHVSNAFCNVHKNVIEKNI